MSEKTEKFLVIEEKGQFLESYKNKECGGLAFESWFTTDISRALATPYQVIKQCPEQLEKLENLAKTFGSRLLVVEATYTITDLDSKPVEVEKTQQELFFEKLAEDVQKWIADLEGLVNDED